MRLILIISLLLISCSEKSKISKSDISHKLGDSPDQIITNFKVDFIDSSWTKTKISAGYGYIFDKKRETILDSNVSAVFFEKNSTNRVSILTSDSALIDDNTKNMYAYQNVVVVSDSTGTRLETEYLEWNEKKQKLISTENVKIDSPEETIYGIGFESDINLNNYKIFKVNGIKKK